MLKKQVYYKRKKNLIAKKIQDEFIVIDPDTEHFYILNETGELIYCFLRKKRKFKEIVNKIIENYNVDKLLAEKDVKDFLSNSSENGMINNF